MQDMRVHSLSWENSLEEMIIHSSILAGEIPWTEEPGRLQTVGSQRVERDLATENMHTQQQEVLKKSYVLGIAMSTLCAVSLLFLWLTMKL